MLTAAGHRAVLGALVFLAVGAVVVAARDGEASVDLAAEAPRASEPEPGADGAATTSTTTAPTIPPDVSVPPGQAGAFTPAPGESAVIGTGTLVTYSVEVEDAVGYAVEAFAATVDAALSDPRSWTADGAVSFQRVASGGQVRIVLATPPTVDGLCLPLQTNGIFSCHQGGTVALNSLRWISGTADWPGTVDEYQAYVVNHEVGHALGHGHVGCPAAGERAPVMMQQSKGLEGCLPNGWPFP